MCVSNLLLAPQHPLCLVEQVCMPTYAPIESLLPKTSEATSCLKPWQHITEQPIELERFRLYPFTSSCYEDVNAAN